MALLGFLIAFPLLVAVALMFLRTDSARDPLVIGSAAIIAIASVACAVVYMGNPTTFAMTPELSLVGNYIAVGIDLFLCGLVFVFAIMYRNAIMLPMSLLQLIISIWCGSFALHPEDAMAEPMYIDNLSVIMILIVGLVGSAICIYALGYMKDFQHHEDEAAARRGEQAPDRRHQFIALMFLFLSALFIIVTSDIVPGEMSAMVKAALAADFAKALEYHRKYYPFFRDQFIETNPIPIKAAMAMVGLMAEEYRLPLCELSPEHREKLAATMKRCGML